MICKYKLKETTKLKLITLLKVYYVLYTFFVSIVNMEKVK